VAIGDRMRAARRSAGLTQEETARRAGLTLKAVGEVERGEVQDPHFSTLASIAGALGMPLAELVGEEVGGAAVPLAEAPQGRAGHDPLSERLRELGHMSDEEFRAWVAGLDLDLDERGYSRGIQRAIAELRERRDAIIDSLKNPGVQAELFGRAQPEELTGTARNREIFRPGRAARELRQELQKEYARRKVYLINYSKLLFAEGITNDYYFHDLAQNARDPHHEELLRFHNRALEEWSNEAYTEEEPRHWPDAAPGGAA
jgi:transcriptional regulator with XRE-family HTH domain